MTLSTGDKLGHDEIVAQAGAGGMGEREARTVASLNHPNVRAVRVCGALRRTARSSSASQLTGKTLSVDVADRILSRASATRSAPG